MEQNEQAIENKAQYIVVDNIEYQLLDGHIKTFEKCLLESENLKISQTMIKGVGTAEDYGVGGKNMIKYVLDGKAILRQGAIDTNVSPGNLVIVPSDMRWGSNLFVQSDQLILLDIARRVEKQETATSHETSGPDSIRIIKPEDVPTYQPAGHHKTTNRCLFVDEHMEIIEGTIEVGGGAERHFHRNHEQMLYMLKGSDKPLLVYYPKGAPHGTGGGVVALLKLLVIYSPPLGESRNALG